MLLRAGTILLAQKLQEAADAREITAGDIRTRLSDAIRDLFRGTGTYGYYVDHIGDATSGDVIYSCDGDVKRAGYQISGTEGTAACCTIDSKAAIDVVPRTIYEPEIEAPAQEAAGKPPAETQLHLVEAAGPEFCAPLRLAEAAGARTSYPVKLISPGTGTMAHYPAAVLERDGPNVFKKGTLMFWNHPTAAEEAARPEGNLDHLAAILKTDAVYNHNGPKGPGLYAEAAVMADYAQKVAERAPHIGLSIRGGGKGTGRLVDGKPELKSLDYAESVDYVTKAGRGGMALAEAARDAGLLDELPVANTGNKQEVSGMDEKVITELRESLKLREANETKLLARAVRGDAREVVTRTLSGITLHEAAKTLVAENIIGTEGAWRPLPMKDGDLDLATFTESVKAEAKRVGAMVAQMTGSGRVYGQGAGDPAPVVDAKEAERQEADQKAEDARYLKVFESLTGNKQAAELALHGRAS